jgi:uncharacterized repeat protein (TIGR01451 family)/CSLREA domain-containing protein
MSWPTMRRAYLSVPLLLAALAGCQDPNEPGIGMQPRASRGSLTIWTVNSPADPGDGVCDQSECTLREAIATAASGDEISFASGLQGTLQLTSELIIQKDLTVNGDGRITLDAQGNSRVMQVGAASVASPITVELNGLALTNGSVFGAGGLAIFFDATVTLRNSTVSGNTSAGGGGGISISSTSSLTLINTTVEGNTAAETGGGIWNRGTLALINSTVEGNEAAGGGPLNQGTAGGLYNDAGATATIVRSTISGNRALNSDMAAGGIFTFGSVDLRSSTVTRNAGPFREAGGLMVWGGGVVSTANSIIAGNEAVDGPFDCSRVNGGTITSLEHNLVSPTCAPGSADVTVEPAQVFTEVLQSALADNGGPTKTHALIARGRAVDAGYCPGESADQRGFARPVDDPTMPNAVDACDVGAYELQGPVAAVADLMISQTVNKTSVKQGELLTYTIRVQNLGPDAAPNVVVTDLLPTGSTFYEARHNKGTHTAPPRGETGTVTWTVGEMLDQANEVAQITVTVLVRGKTTITNTASVTGDVSDPNEANNSASIRVSVASGSAGKRK